MRILFSRIALKDIFATLIIRDKGMIYIYISVNDRDFVRFNFTKLRICEVSRKVNPHENFQMYSIGETSMNTHNFFES